MRVILLLFCVTAVAALPQRIIGGLETEIERYPTIAALLFSWNSVTYWQQCGAIILSTRNVLTAAQCPAGYTVNRWRVRAGSTHANSGGTVLTLTSFVVHTGYNSRTYENDLAVMRSTVSLPIGSTIMPAAIAPFGYFLPDRASVWTAGWGYKHAEGSPSENLHHTWLLTVSQAECKARYSTVGADITDGMLCAGYLDIGGRDACTGDIGGPLYHSGIVVGVISWGRGCGSPHFPRVTTRVSHYHTWILSNMIF